MFAFAPTAILSAAVELNLFTTVEEGSHTASSVASRLGTDERGTRILMDALVGMGYLMKSNQGYHLPPIASRFLVSGKPAFLGSTVTLTEDVWEKWARLPEIVRRGQPVQPVEKGEDQGAFFADFVEALFVYNWPAAQQAARHLGIGTRKKRARILDLGAGSGVWSIAMAQRDPSVTVVAVDRPLVLEVTRRVARRMGVDQQFTFRARDVRDLQLREEYDIAILGHLCHSEGERHTRELFRNLFRSLVRGGKILIAEFIPDDGRKKEPFPLLFAVNMLVNTEEGDTFTFQEYDAWLREAGFSDVVQLQAPALSPLILATR